MGKLQMWRKGGLQLVEWENYKYSGWGLQMCGMGELQIWRRGTTNVWNGKTTNMAEGDYKCMEWENYKYGGRDL